MCIENKNDPEGGLDKLLKYLDSGAFRRRNRVKLHSTFEAVLPHEAPTDDAELAVGSNSVMIAPASLGPKVTISKEREGSRATAADTPSIFPEIYKLAYVLSELHFD